MITAKEMKAIYQSLGGYRVYLGHNQEASDDSYCPELAVWFDENHLDYISLPRKRKPTAGMINKILKGLIESDVHEVVLRFRIYHPSERKYFDPSEHTAEEFTIYRK